MGYVAGAWNRLEKRDFSRGEGSEECVKTACLLVEQTEEVVLRLTKEL